jgi:uncharacterized membrane protein HdeD (DUF308 family)
MNTKSITSGVVMGVVSIVAGLLILIEPQLMRWIIGIFLIVWGVLTVMNKKQSPLCWSY